MPRAIPKPITTKRSRKPAVALKVTEPSRKEPPTTPAISLKGHGIAELAQELADLHKLCIMLSNAEGPAERARNEMAAKAIESDEHTNCCRAVQDFEAVRRRANGMVDGLERLILGLEPRMPGETLSLALILAEELNVFHCNETNHTDSAVMAEQLRLEGALQAVIRGLVHSGATSPLLDYHTARDTLRPWDEARSTATREAAPYLVQYDPAKGRLTTNGRAAP